MKNITLLLIVFLFSVKFYSQTKYDNYDKLILQADSLKVEKNYKLALKKYTEALKIVTPNSSTPFFYAAFSAVKLNNIKKTKYWIIEGIVTGGAQMDYLKNFEGFSEIQTEKYYLDIIANYNQYRQIYFSKIPNIDIYLEVEDLVRKDQFTRKLEDFYVNRNEEEHAIAFQKLIKAQNENDTLAIEKFKKIVFQNGDVNRAKIFNQIRDNVDKRNIERLMEITKEHGWQSRAWLILWHQRGNHDEDNEVWNFFRPIINKEIEEGKLSRTFWKPFEDFKKSISKI